MGRGVFGVGLMIHPIGPFAFLDHDSLCKLKSYLYSYDCLRLESTSKALCNEIAVAEKPSLAQLSEPYQVARRATAVACRIAVVLETAYDMGPPASYPKIYAESDCRKKLRVQCVRFLLNAVHSREQEQDEKRKKAKMHFFFLYKCSPYLPSHVVMKEFAECLMRKAEHAFALLDEPPSPSYSM